jgi:hypothetical protein
VDRRVVPLLLLIAAACTGDPAPHVTTPTVVPRPSPVQLSPLPPRSVTTWFAPLPPLPASTGRPSTGSSDFMELFSRGAPWATAASHIQVFELNGEWVAHTATDAELTQVVADLEARHIALAVQVGPLDPVDGCGTGLEAFAGKEVGLTIARRIQRAGGTIAQVALDQPFAQGHLYDGTNACRWSARHVVRGVSDYLTSVRTVFPDALVGDVEPLWPGAGAAAFEAWIRTYADLAGSDFAFFHFDVDASRPDWPQVAKELEDFCRARGIVFGMIYTGRGDTDQAFAASAEDLIAAYEAKAGGHPDDVVFRSTADEPGHLLPESTPDTLAWLVDRYFRTRSHLDLELGPSQYPGSDRADGVLWDESGARIAGASIRLTLGHVQDDGTLGDVFDIGTRTTDAQGEFRLTFHPPGVYLHLGEVLIEAWFPGNDRFWPAYRSGTITE